MTIEKSVEAIERYGNQGLFVSIVYGPCGTLGNMYSVDVLDPTTGKEFEKPFGCREFGDIAEVLENEVGSLREAATNDD